MSSHFRFVIATTLSLCVTTAVAQPVISKHPTNQSVSLGANVTFTAAATGKPSLNYVWHFNDTNVVGTPAATLLLTNVSLASSGHYSVTAIDDTGSVTSNPAFLAVDPTFTKITTGPVVTNAAISWGAAWGDVNPDGFIDLLVSNEGPELLYRNMGNGTFSQVANSPVLVNDGDLGAGVSFADYDNDGYLDLIVAGLGGPKNKLFHHLGFRPHPDGMPFIKTADNGLDMDGNAESANWGDYDNDGYVDLMVVSDSGVNHLYQNNGDGTFTKQKSQAAGDMLATQGRGISGVWGDFDNDGDLDMVFLYYGNEGRNAIYRNDGNGSFARILQGEAGYYFGGSWGDYDNDGDLDLFVAHGGSTTLESDLLYQNKGDGTFTRVTDGPMVNDHETGPGCAWADYDNDGWLDLYVANPGLTILGGEKGRKNLFYHNNGDGTFTQVTTGSPANDVAASSTGIWGDYDNDGFMDLFVANGGHAGPQTDFLYRNNGNTNGWIKLKLTGTVSNRSAIGAKVRIRATIQGKTLWQMREISGGDGFLSQNDIRPNFGLGDAAIVEKLRIQWPSGTVQELENIAKNQILSVTEPPRLEPNVTVLPNGYMGLTVRGWKGFTYGIEASSDLITWHLISTIQNLTGTLEVRDFEFPGDARFFRLSAP